MTQTLSAQERRYQRKSVTAIGATLVIEGSPTEKIIVDRLKANIELARFDYNRISEAATAEFLRKVRTTKYSEKEITAALEATIMPKILEVVRAVAEERAKGNLSEEALARAAVEKLKGSGLTADDIQSVLNSAYLYLPVIKRYNERREDGKIYVEIEGYVLWFKILEDQNKVVLLQQNPEVESGNSNNDMGKTYTIKNGQLDAVTYTRLMAANTWARNVAQAMKEISDFKLAASVRSVEGGRFTAPLGTREGVYLDEGYDVFQEEEDAAGKAVFKRIGFARIEKVGDNKQNPLAFSELKNYIGSAEEGQTLNEHPRLGIDLVIRPKFGAVNVPPDATYDALSNTAESYFGLEVGFWFNAARFFGTTQLFLVADFGGGLLNASYTSNAVGITPLVGMGYFGVVKKFWFNRLNLNAGAYAGVDVLYLSMNKFFGIESISIYSPGMRLDLGLEYLLSPDLAFGLSAQYKLGFDAFYGEVKFTDETTAPIVGDSRFSDVNFRGLSFGAYISYALPTFSSDLMEGLTASEIEYRP